MKYILIPTQRIPVTDEKGKTKLRVAERECAYIADFVYKDAEGRLVVEDTKGVRTPDYIIKRKLMLAVHGIQIQEV